MFFYTIVMNEEANINEDKGKLLEMVKTYVPKDEYEKEIMKHVRTSLENSGNSGLSSRYGLRDIVFANTELQNAMDRKDKAIDYLIYRYKFKNDTLNHRNNAFPLVLAIEASSLCNLQCKMCFQRSEKFRKDKSRLGVMSMDTYSRILEEIKENQLYSIVFASRGEPLLNPNIDKMIEMAKEHGVLDIKLNTNAVLLNEELSRKLLQSGLDNIVFSVDSAIPKHYQTIRGTSFDVVYNNIKRFCEIRKNEFPDNKIKTRISMVINKCYLDCMNKEVEEATSCWKGIVDELAIKSENDFVGIYEDSEIKNKKCCDLLWERLYIWFDGTVNPCDIDHLSTLAFGKMNKDLKIKDIWNGEEIKKMRMCHLHDRYNFPGVCRNCEGY